VLLATKKRQAVNLFLTDEEEEEFSSNSINRHRSVIKSSTKKSGMYNMPSVDIETFAELWFL
jgi:hypothetical protein